MTQTLQIKKKLLESSKGQPLRRDLPPEIAPGVSFCLEPVMETKTCFKCNQTKPIDDFHKNHKMADGHSGKCKECACLDTRIHYRRNLIQRKEYEFKRSKTKARKEKAKQYFKDHPESVAKAQKKYRAKYPERFKANSLLNNHVNRKGFQKEPCRDCGCTENIYGHHEDYNKPLDVIWLCPPCHSTLHREYRLAYA